jgi:hypothetical protein
MTVYTAQCRHDADQSLKAYQNGVSVIFDAYADDENTTSPYLSPGDARTFARGILALADEVDGGETVKAPKPADEPTVRGIKVGDRIRIITTGSRGARVEAGEIYTVRKVTEYEVQVDGDGANGRWYLSPDDVEIVDEADEPAAPLAEKGPTLPTRAELLSQARDLMSGEDYTAYDLIALADYLAEESA